MLQDRSGLCQGSLSPAGYVPAWHVGAGDHLRIPPGIHLLFLPPLSSISLLLDIQISQRLLSSSNKRNNRAVSRLRRDQR